MSRLDHTLSSILSGWFTNLSAGWFGAAFIIPAFSEKSFEFNLFILISDLVLSVLSLIFAYKIEKEGKEI